METKKIIGVAALVWAGTCVTIAVAAIMTWHIARIDPLDINVQVPEARIQVEPVEIRTHSKHIVERAVRMPVIHNSPTYISPRFGPERSPAVPEAAPEPKRELIVELPKKVGEEYWAEATKDSDDELLPPPIAQKQK